MPNFTVTKNIAQAASVFVICLGCVVLIGWTFDIALLKSLLPGLVTMKVNAAVAFLLNVAAVFLVGAGSGLVLTLAGVFKVCF